MKVNNHFYCYNELPVVIEQINSSGEVHLFGWYGEKAIEHISASAVVIWKVKPKLTHSELLSMVQPDDFSEFPF